MKLICDFEFMELDEDIIAVPVGDEMNNFHGIIKLNSTGKLIFQHLMENMSITNIVTNIVEENPDTPIDVIKEYVDEFIAQLRNDGVIVD